MLLGRGWDVGEEEVVDLRSCVGFSLAGSFLRKSSAFCVASWLSEPTFCFSFRDDSPSQEKRTNGISMSTAKRMRIVYHPQVD